MKNKLTDGEILMEIYKRMFREAEPSGNIDEMIKSGEAKQQNFFMKYYLRQERQDEIIQEVCKENKITKKHRIQAFKTACALGSSPTGIRDAMLEARRNF